MGVQYLTVLGLSQMFMCIESMTVGALSGIGKTFLSSIISISLTSARVPLAAADASGIKWRVVGVVLDKCGKRNYLFYCILKGFKEPDSARRDKLDAKQKKADIMSGIGRIDDNASACHCHGYE